jgi:hypothetical protein
MPLNQPKTWAYTPKGTGAVKLVTRSSRRSRLWIGGTFFRSHERGEAANAIQITCVEDLTNVASPEGLLVVHHTVLKPDEQVFVSNMSMPQVDLFDLNLLWDEEIRVQKVGTALVARKYGIRWQIAGGEELRADLGAVTQNRLVTAPGVAFKVDAPVATWPTNGVLYLRPRTHRYTLVTLSVTDPDTAQVSTGWDIGALRTTLNGSDTWVRMPVRPAGGGTEGGGGPLTGGEDAMDDQTDATFLTAFSTTNMTGGDGLPKTPVGLNTGPDRVLVHLNYAEKDDGSLGELNQVFEWQGDTATIGSWQRYA